MVRRSTAPAAGMWSVPGGRVEPDESLADAIRREVREETGLEVEVGEVVGRIELDVGASSDNLSAVRYAVTDFYATPLDPAAPLVAGDDALDARWVTKAELADLPTSPGLTETLAEWGIWASGRR